MFSFPLATKMFQFARFPVAPKARLIVVDTMGLPHSEIPGSKDARLLPEAYRSLPRPSSASLAKTSTKCPYPLE